VQRNGLIDECIIGNAEANAVEQRVLEFKGNGALGSPFTYRDPTENVAPLKAADLHVIRNPDLISTGVGLTRPNRGRFGLVDGAPTVSEKVGGEHRVAGG
jgi:hypothetical protein